MYRERVLVAMSGGVDSSVALSKLLDEGYDAFGVTMKLWETKDPVSKVVRNSNCNTVEAINGAKMVCDRMGVNHYTLDFIDVFKKSVIDDFTKEYLNGRTPNPCVRCNSFVKWETLLKQADIYEAKYIATGHYARIENYKNNPILKKGLDPNKDQSYMLWQIDKKYLIRTLFPIGNMTKDEVRKYADENNLETAQTTDSMDLCFVDNNDYSQFLNEIMPEKMNSINSGDIINENEKVIGQHSGFTNYTVGQRKGLGLSYHKPLYVKKINPINNTIMVSEKGSIFSDNCIVSNVNWIIEAPQNDVKAFVKIRYNSYGCNATISKFKNNYRIKFNEPQLAITPGQSAVFYKDDVLIGGGIIEADKL